MSEVRHNLKELIKSAKRKGYIKTYKFLIDECGLSATQPEFSKWINGKANIKNEDCDKMFSFLNDNGWLEENPIFNYPSEISHDFFHSYSSYMGYDLFSKNHIDKCKYTEGIYEYFRESEVYDEKILRGMMVIDIDYIDMGSGRKVPALFCFDDQKVGGLRERNFGCCFVFRRNNIHIIYRNNEDKDGHCDAKMMIMSGQLGEDNLINRMSGRLISLVNDNGNAKNYEDKHIVFRRWTGEKEDLLKILGVFDDGEFSKDDLKEIGLIRKKRKLVKKRRGG